MKKTIYREQHHYVGELDIYIYTPIEVDVVEEEWRGNYLHRLKHQEDDGSFSWITQSNYLTYVKGFKPDDRHVLISEYTPIIVPCITDVWRHQPSTLHERCEVLPNKRGGYTIVQCLDCGEEHALAMNHLLVCKPDTEFDFKCTDLI